MAYGIRPTVGESATAMTAPTLQPEQRDIGDE